MEPPLNDRGREPTSESGPITTPQPHPSQDHTELRNPASHPVTRRSPRPQTSSTLDKFEDDSSPLAELHRDNTTRSVQAHLPPLPPAHYLGAESRPSRFRPGDSHVALSRSDKFFPVKLQGLTVGERLRPTINEAEAQRIKYAAQAKLIGFALNAAIGLQVLVGSLITGLSSMTSGRQLAISTTVLGGLNTLVAGYLARARGSGEPELSLTLVKNLEHFLRKAEAFLLDRGHVTTEEFDHDLTEFRLNLEQILGNVNRQDKPVPPGAPPV